MYNYSNNYRRRRCLNVSLGWQPFVTRGDITNFADGPGVRYQFSNKYGFLHILLLLSRIWSACHRLPASAGAEELHMFSIELSQKLLHFDVSYQKF